MINVITTIDKTKNSPYAQINKGPIHINNIF